MRSICCIYIYNMCNLSVVGQSCHPPKTVPHSFQAWISLMAGGFSAPQSITAD